MGRNRQLPMEAIVFFILAAMFLSSSAASSFRKSREEKRLQFSLGLASKSASESIYRQKEAEQVSFPNSS